jgi:vitamin B12 transporter
MTPCSLALVRCFFRRRSVLLGAITGVCLYAPWPLAAFTGSAAVTGSAETPRSAETPSTEEALRLRPIVVTATRRARTVDATLAAVTVIDQAEIVRLQPRSLPDLLRSRPGVDITQNGAFGQQTSLFLRGSNSNSAVLLVDGVRVSSATTGAPAWEFLPIGQVERVELVRGPRSSLYGADAIGGILQVFTRSGEGPATLYGQLGVGSFNTHEASLGVSGSATDTRYHFAAGRQHTDGVNILAGIGDDRADGMTRDHLSMRLEQDVRDDFQVFGSVLYAQGEADFDQNPDPARDWDDFLMAAGHLGMRLEWHPHWTTQFSLGQSRDSRKTRLAGDLRALIATRRHLWTWLNEVALAPGLEGVLGIDHQRDRVDYDDGWAAYQRSQKDYGYFIQMQKSVGRQQFSGSLRLDDHSAYGRHSTGQWAWGYDLGEFWQTRVGYGTAFRAPTFNDLYYPGFSNPDLQPEHAQQLEVGLRRQGTGSILDMVLFQNDIRDLILFDPVVSRPVNLHEARIRGLEVEWTALWQAWRMGSALTHLQHENLAEGTSLPRRPDTTLRLDLDHQTQDWSYGGTLTGQTHSFDDPANTLRISGFGLLDLRTAYHLSPRWTLRARLANVLDREYTTALHWSSAPYQSPGRAVYLNLHFQQ